MYDYQMIVLQRFGGISRYICDLATAFSKEHDVKTPVLFPKSFYFESYFGKKSSRFALWRWNKSLVYPLNKLYNIFKLLLDQPDILHLTYYNAYLLPFIPAKTKLVVTAHDMIHEIYPEVFPAWDRTTKHKRKVFAKADLVIAISENTKKDLIRYFHLDPDKIQVIYHGNPFGRINPSEDFQVDAPYFLFVGQRDRYKNFGTLLQAIAPILQEKNYKLLCLGGKPFNEGELSQFQELGLSALVERRNGSDADLQAAYKNALCMIYPSEYEGFGIPILESWAMDCPLILSDASCFPEIAKDGALYFQPKDALELRAKIQQLLSNPELRKTLVAKGQQYIQDYSLEETLRKTLNAYCKTITPSENV
jgi:glycosyltransferase involved in cell wall biosynthesis